MGCCVDLNKVCGVKSLLTVLAEVKSSAGYVSTSTVVSDAVPSFSPLSIGGRITKKFI